MYYISAILTLYFVNKFKESMSEDVSMIRGGVKKVVLLGGGGRFRKKVPLFVLLPFDAEAFKTC